MALADKVTDRYSNKFLLQITNPGGPSATPATSVDTTLLGTAATDAEAMFKVYTGVAYDNDNAVHVMAATQVVITLLNMFTGRLNHKKAMDQVQSLLKDVGLTTGHDKITPVTNSDVTVEDRDANGEVFPEFRFKSFDGTAVENRPKGITADSDD